MAWGLLYHLFGRRATAARAVWPLRRDGPPRHLVAVLLLGALGLAAGGSVRGGLRPPAALPVATVSALQHQIAPHPQEWWGRTVRVQAVIVGFLRPLPDHQRRMHLALIDPGVPDGPWSELLLVPGAENPLLHLLRTLPLVGVLVPPAQRVQWQARHTYRIQLWPLPGPSCALCSQAVLLDAA